MKLAYDEVVNWLDAYFASCNEHQGGPDDVANLTKWFAPDLEFMMYTPPSFVVPPLSRQQLLMLFVHPGIREHLRPQYYAIDLEKNIAVVQFEIQFVEEPSGRAWPALQASCHYHLVVDDTGTIRIGKIKYWTQSHGPEDDYAALFEEWAAAKDRALEEFAAKDF
jgi:hypothetical protein